MKKILLAEDEDTIARLVQFKLEKSGFEVTSVRNGREALEQLRENRPDLILLDVMMPEINGIEVLERIKRDDALKDVPVIMLSARGQKADIERCLSSGAVDYILKPFAPSELVKRINTFIDRKDA